MTLKLYLNNSYETTFKAKVLSFEGCDGVFKLILDRTIFYPVSGGQDHDTGVIRSSNGLFNVLMVNELDDGTIVHIGDLNGFMSMGDYVEGALNWDRRYKLMKMHTAAHILIQAVRKYFNENVNCVSASKRVDGGHLDFSANIQRDMLKGIEDMANGVVNENRPVIIHYMDVNEAGKYISRYGESLDLYLRKHVPEGTIRIVEVKDWIAIPCGGTHVRSSGEIGIIQLIKRESKGKGIVRIYYDVR